MRAWAYNIDIKRMKRKGGEWWTVDGGMVDGSKSHVVPPSIVKRPAVYRFYLIQMEEGNIAEEVDRHIRMLAASGQVFDTIHDVEV